METDFIVGHSLESPHRILSSYTLFRIESELQIALQQPDFTRAPQGGENGALLGGNIGVLITCPEELPVRVVAIANGSTVDCMTQINGHRILLVGIGLCSPSAVIGLCDGHTIIHLILARPVAHHCLQQHLILTFDGSEGVVQSVEMQVNWLDQFL